MSDNIPTSNIQNESDRLRIIRESCVLNIKSDKKLDYITSLAAQLFETPIACISIYYEGNLHLLSHYGLEVEKLPCSGIFCEKAIINDKELIVFDAEKDPQFSLHPFVVGPPHIRFYAGALIKYKNVNLGTFCVMDDKPHNKFSEKDIFLLKALAQIVSDKIDTRTEFASGISDNVFLKRLFDHIPIGIFVKDVTDDFRYKIVNKKSLELFEKNIESMIGKTDYEIFEKNEAAYFRQTDMDVMAKGEVVHIPEEPVTTGRGTWLARTHKTPLYDHNGNPSLLLGIFEEITAQKEQEKALTEARTIAENANTAKSDFLANMSHEIRTPLNGVLATTDLLGDTTLDDYQTQLVSLIKNSGEMLLSLLNDILDYSKIEANKLELRQEIFDLQKLMNITFDLFQVSAKSKGLTFKKFIHPSVPQWVITDPQRLRQIVSNLLSNAIKYTNYGVVSISIDVSHKNNEPYLFIQVQDTGKGISKEAQSVIFEKFIQVHKSAVIAGTGLGLAICKSLATLLGGDIGVVSEVGVGSIFWVTIPLCETGDTQIDLPMSETTSHLITTDRQPSMLVVEDNMTNQFVITEMLKKLGCKVDAVDNGLKAVEIARRQSFDIIFMDCNMPVMDGYDATKIMRTELRIKTPIIGVSAHVFAKEIQNCIAVGMNDFITKPIQKKSLIEVMNNWLLQALIDSQENQDLPEEPKPVAELPDDDFDISALDEFKADFPNKFAELIHITLENSWSLFHQLCSAVEARDEQAIVQHAHALKSVAAQVGGMGLSKLCFDLEKAGRVKKIEYDRFTPAILESAYSKYIKRLEALSN